MKYIINITTDFADDPLDVKVSVDVPYEVVKTLHDSADNDMLVTYAALFGSYCVELMLQQHAYHEALKEGAEPAKAIVAAMGWKSADKDERGDANQEG